MTKETILTKLLSSHREDWTLTSSSTQKGYLNADVNLRFEGVRRPKDERGYDWLEALENKNAKDVVFHVYYNSTLIQTESLVIISRDLLYFPFPNADSSLSILGYKLSKILDNDDLVEGYVRRLGLKIPTALSRPLTFA